MKKRISFLLAILLLAFSLAVPVFAAGFEDAQLGFVTDEAGLLSEDEYRQLEQQAQAISRQYECGVYIITLDDFTNYTYDTDPYEAAKTIYSEYALGYGTEKSGILMMLSMAERDCTLIAFGYGNTAFTDYGRDKLYDVFLDDFHEDDWYTGFEDYLAKCDSMLKAARDGHPLDVGSNPLITIVGTALSLLLGFALAFGTCLTIEQRQMKSVAAKEEANTYLTAGSVQITNRSDRFSHTTETRTRIERESSSSGGTTIDSGGTTIDSDGFSGSSRKF